MTDVTNIAKMIGMGQKTFHSTVFIILLSLIVL